jgi:hypothetical protein
MNLAAPRLSSAQARLFQFQVPEKLSEIEAVQAIRWQLRTRVADGQHGQFSVQRQQGKATVLYWSDRTIQPPLIYPAAAITAVPNTLVWSRQDEALVLPNGEVLHCIAEPHELPAELVLALARHPDIHSVHCTDLTPQDTLEIWSARSGKAFLPSPHAAPSSLAHSQAKQTFVTAYALSDNVVIREQSLWPLNMLLACAALACLSAASLYYRVLNQTEAQQNALHTALHNKGLSQWADAEARFVQLQERSASRTLPAVLRALAQQQRSKELLGLQFDAGLVNLKLGPLSAAQLTSLEQALRDEGLQVRCVQHTQESKCQLSR